MSRVLAALLLFTCRIYAAVALHASQQAAGPSIHLADNPGWPSGNGAVQQRPPDSGQHPSPAVPAHIRAEVERLWYQGAAAAAGSTLHNQGLVQIAYSDPSSGVYLGSPSIARLDPQTLLVSHDTFPEWGRPKATTVWSSQDGGASWQRRAVVPRQYWSTLFVHRGALYLLGTDDSDGHNAVAISRSTDGGETWNQSMIARPSAGCHFGTGAMPVLLQGGILYRSMEYWCGTEWAWPQFYHALLLSAPADADLLSPASWSASQARQFSSDMLPAWMPGPMVSGGYLEGNAVSLPGGAGVGLLLRCLVYDAQGRTYTMQHACLFQLRPGPSPGPAAPGSDSLAWQDFVDMPGGGNRFTARWVPEARRYLALTNPSIDRYGSNPDARNILVLVHSTDLLSWRIATTVLIPNDGLTWEQSLWMTGYHYADWIVDGSDILAAVRTAYDGAHSYHDSNRITFKRIGNFRRYLPPMPA
ncbi:hypothetical protein ABPG75_004525 [Micractinium tetrahymenae]